MPLPGGTCLALLGFPDARRGGAGRARSPQYDRSACDLLDRRLLSVTRGGRWHRPDPAGGRGGAARHIRGRHRARGDRAGLGRRRDAALAAPDARAGRPDLCPGGRRAACAASRAAAVAGLNTSAADRGRSRSSRTSACPPEALPEFLAGVQDILKRFEVCGVVPRSTSLTGQVHTRPARRPRRPGRPREAVAARRGGPRAGPRARRHGQHAARHRPRPHAVGRAAVRPAATRCSAS